MDKNTWQMDIPVGYPSVVIVLNLFSCILFRKYLLVTYYAVHYNKG